MTQEECEAIRDSLPFLIKHYKMLKTGEERREMEILVWNATGKDLHVIHTLESGKKDEFSVPVKGGKMRRVFPIDMGPHLTASVRCSIREAAAKIMMSEVEIPLDASNEQAEAIMLEAIRPKTSR